MAGDFNANLAIPEGLERAEDVVVALATAGLEEIGALYSAPIPLGPIYQGVEYDISGAGGAISDGLYPGEGPLSI